MTENLFDVLGILIAFITVMLIFSIAITSLVQATQGLLRWRARNLQIGLAKILRSVQEKGSGDNARENAIGILNNSDAALINSWIKPQGRAARFFGPQLSWMEPDELDRELRKQINGRFSDAQKTEISQKFRRAQGAMSKTFLRRVRIATMVWAFLIAFYYQLSTPALLQQFSTDPALVAQLESQARDMQRRQEGGGDDPPPEVDANADVAYFKLQPWQEGRCFFYHFATGEPACEAGDDDPPDGFFERVQWHNIVGVLISVLLLSLGAPFWFDMLKQVVNLKDTLAKTTGAGGSAAGDSGSTADTKSTDDRILLLTERLHATSNPVLKASLQKEINDLRLIKAENP